MKTTKQPFSGICSKIIKSFLVAAVLIGVPGGAMGTSSVSAQTCVTAPATTYGQVTQSVDITTAGTYRVWSRVKAPDTTNNSYYFQVDGGCVVTVGDASIPASTWTWVNYKDGSTSSFVDVTLTAGAHTLKYTGKEADVQLDRILLLTDTSCVPTGTGDNCASIDSTPPTTSITAPAAGKTITTGTTETISAGATDNVGVTKVEFYVDGALKGSDTTSPYSYAWSTTGVASGTHALTSKAYDAYGNIGTSSPVSVTVKAANELIISPSEDATIVEASPTTNYGSATALELDNSPVKELLVKLSVTGTAGKTIESAKLRLYNSNASDSGGTFHATGTSWSQGTVNWSTAPAAGTQVASLGSVSAGTWYELDVKSLVTGDGTFALRAKSASPTGNGADYNSLEGANKPQLIITTGTSTADTTAPTVSLTSPQSGSSASVGSTVTIAANASDNVGVAKVEFYSGTTLLTTDTAAPYSHAWNTAGQSAGTKTLTAKAYDAAGNAAASTAVSLNLTSTTSGSGDANGDGRVNAIDLSVLISRDGQNYPAADFDGNGTVGAGDLSILLSKWTW